MHNVKCLFGFHEYTIPDKNNERILICKHCKRKGHRELWNGYEKWYDYDENSNIIHSKDSNGFEWWEYENV